MKMRWTYEALAVGLLLRGTTGQAAESSRLAGDWTTPGGSVVRVEGCGPDICLTVVKVSPTAKGTTDALNPDPTLRSRPACGLRIGSGFKPESTNAANGGHIYDPESGKTYSSKLVREGDRLKLRGFVGISLFGRTEVWTRTQQVQACAKS